MGINTHRVLCADGKFGFYFYHFHIFSSVYLHVHETERMKEMLILQERQRPKGLLKTLHNKRKFMFYAHIS